MTLINYLETLKNIDESGHMTAFILFSWQITCHKLSPHIHHGSTLI